MTQDLSQTTVEEVLKQFVDPETGRDVLTMEQVSNLQVEGDNLRCDFGLTTHSAPIWESTRNKFEQHLRDNLPALESLEVNHVVHDRPAPPVGEFGLTVKSVIAVGSGKGGVGKSTIAASLALGLKAAGSRVGIMDADVYGPSIPQLLGVNEAGNPTVNADKKIVPVDADGIPVLSMGFMVPEGEAVIWRGPMLHGAITQFLRDAAWGDLDYLIIDMPPGTGDIALTLSQVIPLTGAVVVCTPQRVTLLDAVKSIAMFRKVNIPVLGMVENMSGFICPDSDKRYDIFGSGGAKTSAGELNVPFLGEVPIIPSIREHGDAGTTQQNLVDPGSSQYLTSIVETLVGNMAGSAEKEPPQPQLPVLG